MSYIYDILVNYKYPLLDFYEWNKNDNIDNIKKIPVIKVSKNDLNKISNYQFKLLNLDLIANKTSIYSKKQYKYACIFSDGDEAISFLFNNSGICIGKSRLLLDEEEEVLELISNNKIYKINYKLIKKDKIEYYKTVNEIKKRKYIIKQLNKTHDVDKLNYIYYDCFNKVDNDPKSNLLASIDEYWDEIGYKLYDFFHIK